MTMESHQEFRKNQRLRALAISVFFLAAIASLAIYHLNYQKSKELTVKFLNR